MDKVLTVEHLGKRFKDKQVVEGITFEVHRGEIMAVLGPNGAGKTTSIRNIMGIQVPDEGRIIFENEPSGHVPRQKIGYLPEERGLYKNVRVIDILLYFAELKDYPLDKAKERVSQMLTRFGLEGMEKRKVEELSKGMGQKVQFIGAILHEPELLILDEPFSGLDPVSQELFKEEIKRLADQGTAILLSSHQMNLVEALCDRLIMIHQGRQIIYGSIDQIKSDYANYKCTLRGQNDKSVLEAIAGVEQVEQTGDLAVLYLQDDIQPLNWLKTLPETLDVQELSIDRISLHEIFVQVATGQLGQEVQ